METDHRRVAGKGVASTPFAPGEWERVGATLRSLRELRGYNPNQFAALLGISRAYLVNIEAGRKKLTNILLARSAEALAVPQLAIMRPDAGPEDSGVQPLLQERLDTAATSSTPALEEAGAHAL
ncbi:helix-turn-helix domain-containing protein [Nocardia sp. NPDC004711]